MEQPERQQRLHDKAAGKGVQTEQSRKLVDDVPGWSERSLRHVRRMAVVARQAPVKQRRQQSQRAISVKHQLDGAELQPAVGGEDLRQCRGQRSDGSGE